MKLNWLNKKWVIILVHSLCWILLFSLPFLLRTYARPEHRTHQPDDVPLLYFYFVSSAIWIVLFYVHAYVFLRFAQRRKKFALFLGFEISGTCNSVYFTLVVFYFICNASHHLNRLIFLFTISFLTCLFLQAALLMQHCLKDNVQ